MTADIRLAVSVIRTVFAQNHRAAATAADDHANTPNNKKRPLLHDGEGANLKTGCKKFHGHYSAANFSTPEFKFPARV